MQKRIYPMKILKRMFSAALLAVTPVLAGAQLVSHDRLLSFEEKDVPSFISCSGSQASISDKHFREGIHSLRWDFTPGSTLEVNRDLCFEPKDPTGNDTYLSAFIVWVYNETAQDRTIRFEFLKDGKVCSSFPFGINFTGWRGAWVCYERDMEGNPAEGMNRIRIVAPSDISGSLFFDHMLTAAKVDARQQTPDIQVPFVNEGTDNHWLVVYPHSLYTSDLPLEPLTASQIADIRKMEERFRDMIYTPSALTEKELSAIRERFKYYGIRRDSDRITGRPIWFVRQSEAYERLIPGWDKDMFTKAGVEMTDYFKLMKRIATAWNNASGKTIKEELAQLFLDMYDNITDQGVVYGSCWGNIHHYGYSTRDLFVSYFLMKDILRQAGKLEQAVETLKWYAITNEVFPRPAAYGIDIDTLNTKVQGRIASILIMENTPEKLRYLRSFSRWIDYGCRPADGLSGSFKTDGACFHHCNNYPAYAVGGLDGATNMLYLFSDTEFAFSPLAHSTIKNVLLAMRFYCNTFQWPLSMSGRHPNGGGELVPVQYAVMAKAGTPDRSQEIDPDMAAAFLRLATLQPDMSKDEPDYKPKTSTARIARYRSEFEAMGYKPEPEPNGNLALGYGCVSVQRRNNWAAVVRGHSRYLWAAEHYLPANFYGRYLAHGSMQILTGPADKAVTFTTSGWQENGFDWNRIPGATSIHLPFEQLRAVVLNVDTCSGMEEMLYSDEAFAGGLSQNRTNGNFGMVLHEHDKYNGSHRARKSYHFFNGTIVCLGSDIENTNHDNPTETTVFQNAATTTVSEDYWNSYSTPDGRTFIDPNGTGYCIAKSCADKAKYIKAFPQVTVGERSVKPTSGNWVSLVIEHGKAPKGESYEYAVLPNTDAETLKAFARKPTYKVLRRDANAHIVASDADRLTSYVLFEPPAELPSEGMLQGADTCCLVMIHQPDKNNLTLTVAQPDLALYRGPSDEAFDENGLRIERSIYSRPWKGNPSGEIPVTVTLKGRWQPTPDSCCILVKSDRKSTTLRFDCRDGASYDVKLNRI